MVAFLIVLKQVMECPGVLISEAIIHSHNGPSDQEVILTVKHNSKILPLPCVL